MIELKNIAKTYHTGKVHFQALKGASLKIERGEFVAIMGPSGSGKSTMLHILGFLDKPDSGSYTFMGKEITGFNDNYLAYLRNTAAGFIFQQFFLVPRISTLENVELPLIYAGDRDLKDKAKQRITEVGLISKTENLPNELSGGEQQRIVVARSLVNEPVIIFADEPTGNLDTKNKIEIMSILHKLNEEGKTIVMVTHEKEMAEYAGRIIHMKDGEIISEERTVKYKKAEIQAELKENIFSKEHAKENRAEFFDHMRQAVKSITAHKMRTFLSVLGIFIGVAAVIAMLALGEGAKESVKQSISNLGSNLLMIRPGSSRVHGVALEAGAVTRFTIDDTEAIGKLGAFIKNVSSSVSGSAQVVYGNKNWRTRMQGTGVAYAVMRASVPPVGRFFSEEEVKVRAKVAVLGATVVKELFGDVDPVGENIKINKINFKVIGILPAKGAGGWQDQDDIIIIPVTTAMYRVLGKEYVDSMDVEMADPLLKDEIQEKIKQLIIKRHRLTKENEDSFQIRDMAEIQQALQSVANTMTMLLGAIAAISLLVGGIGIMNIMLVSVTERTREIGLRKAIGARATDIMVQFLIESVVLTVIGGIAGIIFGIGVSAAMAKFAGWAVRVAPFSVILSLVFSVLVGIGFGLWPARQAAQLNPIEALRYE